MNGLINNEKGAVLITGLLILLVLTLIGIAGMNNSTLEEMMSRNYSSRNIAFQAAEAALREGEDFLTSATLPPFPGTNATHDSSGLYGESVDLSGLTWDVNDSAQYSGTISGVDAPPRFIIEELVLIDDEGNDSLVEGTEVSERQMYRVTARGVGSLPGTVVILQTTYLR